MGSRKVHRFLRPFLSLVSAAPPRSPSSTPERSEREHVSTATAKANATSTPMSTSSQLSSALRMPSFLLPPPFDPSFHPPVISRIQHHSASGTDAHPTFILLKLSSAHHVSAATE